VPGPGACERLPPADAPEGAGERGAVPGPVVEGLVHDVQEQRYPGIPRHD